MAMLANSPQPLLDVQGLVVRIGSKATGFDVVRGVSFQVQPGETVCIVGESGSGKTLTALTLLGLHADPVRIASGRIALDGADLISLSERDFAALRGDRIAMVFQDPMTSLNPVLTIGEQISEVISAHREGLGRSQLRAEAVDLLKLVGIPAAAERLDAYPHQLSGGMRQRILIAIALANQPRVIVADEPTTALDVTIQAQVMDVMRAAVAKSGAALLLITHDMGLVAETADRVLVMYAGRIVESGSVYDVFREPRHPYTRALLSSIPRVDGDPDAALEALGGEPPRLSNLPPGCSFRPRCKLSAGRAACTREDPQLREITVGHAAACHFAEELVDQMILQGDAP
ncbi:ABC transporter ATP-binding protein [Devosia honganensis]|uniref:ABC transporter ATP-binding protein n=1 Tax=Devosia honganensis TaxID=1610527 RepID=A0ABV7X873_9HYPH